MKEARPQVEADSANRQTSEEGPRRRPPHAQQEERQQTILRAALETFSENGFAATRLEDVARRAGVAKGTLYLYFPDKEALFESMLKSFAAPALARLASLAADEKLTLAEVLDHFIAFVQTQVLGTPREKVIRLIIAEGPRFPRLAKFYYDEVISKALVSLREIFQRGESQGIGPAAAFARYPQLFFAPVLMSILWRGLFSEYEPLDVAGMLSAYRDLFRDNIEGAK
ncbi:MAG: TetR/AcrR family transcriptional regulator [Rhodomicrobium sp.]